MEGRDWQCNGGGGGGKKGVQKEVQGQNRGRGREEGWKARQKERAAATPRHLGCSSSAGPPCSSSEMGLCVEMIDHATQGKVRRARARSDVPAGGAGVRWATLGAPLRCVRAIVRGGAGMSHGRARREKLSLGQDERARDTNLAAGMATRPGASQRDRRRICCSDPRMCGAVRCAALRCGDDG
jgi:hypothetical protein